MKERISKMAKSISLLQSSKLRIHLPNILNHKQDKNHFFTMRDYLKFEVLLAQYDLNSVAQRVGDIYHALDEYFHRSRTEVRDSISWNMLSEAQVVHLAVLLICEVSKTKLPPLYNFIEESHQIGVENSLSEPFNPISLNSIMYFKNIVVSFVLLIK
jgi:hypothetical protein